MYLFRYISSREKISISVFLFMRKKSFFLIPKFGQMFCGICQRNILLNEDKYHQIFKENHLSWISREACITAQLFYEEIFSLGLCLDTFAGTSGVWHQQCPALSSVIMPSFRFFRSSRFSHTSLVQLELGRGKLMHIWRSCTGPVE